MARSGQSSASAGLRASAWPGCAVAGRHGWRLAALLAALLLAVVPARPAQAAVAITQPVPGATVASPLTVRGVADGEFPDQVGARLVATGSGAVLAETTIGVQRTSSGQGSFAATLIFAAPAEPTPAQVRVAAGAPDGDILATVDVTIGGGASAGAPQISVSQPSPGAVINGNTVQVRGIEASGAYDGPIVARLVIAATGQELAAATTVAQRSAPGQPGNWGVDLIFTRPATQTPARVEVLAGSPTPITTISVSLFGVMTSSLQASISSPGSNAGVTSPLAVRGLVLGGSGGDVLLVRLRDRNTNRELAAATTTIPATDPGRPAPFTAVLNFLPPDNDTPGVVEVAVVGGSADTGAASQVIATQSVVIEGD